MKKTIYIPIEIKAREFYSQVLLASALAKLGARVYLGSKSGIFSIIKGKQSKAGTLLYKGGMGGDDFKRLKSKLDSIAVLDQEISPALRDLAIIPLRFTLSELRYIDRHYFVGDKFAKAMKDSRPNETEGKVRSFGWPRIDLWTGKYKNFWDKEVFNITQQYGKFVLFSSDFGVLCERDIQFRMSQSKEWKSNENADWNTDNLEEKWKTILTEFKEVVKFLQYLDNDPRIPTIIIRPHPAENHEEWIKVVSGLKKTKLIFKGDITPWLLASEALLHRGCTTALQAILMKKPVGSIQIVDNFEESISRKLSTIITTSDDVLRLIKSDVFSSINDDLIASKNGMAAELIARDLLDLTFTSEKYFQVNKVYMFFKNLVLSAPILLLRQAKKKKYQIPSEVSKNKMPGGITAGEVREVLKNLKMFNVTVKQVLGDVVCLEENEH